MATSAFAGDVVRRHRMDALESVVLKVIGRFSHLSVRVSGYLLLICTAAICVEILTRRLLGRSLFSSDEMSGYVLAIVVSWGLTLALVRLAHVRIDILRAVLPAPLQASLDVLSVIAMSGFGAVLTYFASQLALQALSRGTVSNDPTEMPMFIPLGLWSLGLLFFTLSATAISLIAVRRFLKGNWTGVATLAGILRVEDEAREQVRELEDN